MSTSLNLAVVEDVNTLGELTTLMQTIFEDDGDEFTALIHQKANHVYRTICAKYDWTWMRSSSTIALTSGLVTYALEDDVDVVLGGIMTIESQNKVLEQVSPGEVDRRAAMDNAYAANTVPSVFAMSGDRTITIHPAPSSSLTAFYRYQKLVPPMKEDADEPDLLPYKLRGLWVLGVEAKLRPADNRFDGDTRFVAGDYESELLTMYFRDQEGVSNESRKENPPPSAV